MTGTIVNAIAIIVGGVFGILLRKGLPPKIEDVAMPLVGLGVTVIGINGTLVSMMTVNPETGRLSDSGGIVLILSLVIGGLLGEFLKLDDAITTAGQWIEQKLGAEGFARGFVASSLLFCIGAMAIVGALADGLSGDSSILFVKSTIDGITAVVMGASLGIGVPFAAVPVFLYQGAISLGAGLLSPVLTGVLLDQTCMVGYCIVIVIGTNVMGITRFKTANMLPCLLIPAAYQMINSAL